MLGAGIRSTPFGMAASGVGAAGGEGWRQVGQRVFGSPDAPQTSGEAAKRMGGAFLRGSLGELGAKKVVGPALGWLSGTFDRWAANASPAVLDRFLPAP